MSSGWASSSLCVICKDAEQAKSLIQKFRIDQPEGGIFEAWQEKNTPCEIQLDLIDSDVSHSFDNDVLNLSQWLTDNFNLPLSGHWRFELDGEWRCEVKNGEIIDAGLDWIAHFTVEQIHEIRKWAEKQYSTKIAS